MMLFITHAMPRNLLVDEDQIFSTAGIFPDDLGKKLYPLPDACPDHA